MYHCSCKDNLKFIGPRTEHENVPGRGRAECVGTYGASFAPLRTATHLHRSANVPDGHFSWEGPQSTYFPDGHFSWEGPQSTYFNYKIKFQLTPAAKTAIVSKVFNQAEDSRHRTHGFP